MNGQRDMFKLPQAFQVVYPSDIESNRKFAFVANNIQLIEYFFIYLLLKLLLFCPR